MSTSFASTAPVSPARGSNSDRAKAAPCQKQRHWLWTFTEGVSVSDISGYKGIL